MERKRVLVVGLAAARSMRLATVLAAILVVFAGPQFVAATQALQVDFGEVYAVSFTEPSGPSRLWRVHSTSDALVGTITSGSDQPTITDIALRSDGQLFGVSFSTLYVIDKVTAMATPIGSGTGENGLNALTFSSGGDLYSATAGGARAGHLLGINPSTGVATDIGTYGSTLRSSGDLSFVGSTVYATVDKRFHLEEDDLLVRVDTGSGKATRVSRNDLGFNRVYGLFTTEGQLFGLTYQLAACSPNGAFIRIDLSMGTASFERCLSFNAYGAAAVP